MSEVSSGRVSFLTTDGAVCSSFSFSRSSLAFSDSASEDHIGSFTVRINTTSATIITAATEIRYTEKSVFPTSFVLNTIPSPRTSIPPAVPIRLIIALPLERSGFTVTSGINATAGERNVAIERRHARRRRMNHTRDPE